MKNDLKQIAANSSPLPGVYMFKDASGHVLYVGKANQLRVRLLQYFDSNRLEPAKKEMVAKAASIDTIVVSNETEALALEATLIREHRPPFNIRLVDDSSYLYIKITDETYPKVELTRKVLPDGAWYRGPYPNARAVRQTLKEARRIFPWCAYDKPSGKLCFAYHIGLCPGICAGKISLEEYQMNFSRLKKFLDGDTEAVISSLKKRMAEQSGSQNYEQAAKSRDSIKAVERTMIAQNVISTRDESADVFGISSRDGHGAIALLKLRHGKIISRQIFSLLIPKQLPEQEIMREFLGQYYRSTTEKAEEILLPSAPHRGWKKALINMANLNANEALARSETEMQSPANLQKGLNEIAAALHLRNIPKRIECFDISNIQGKLATASMIVFTDGKPDRSQYRKFGVISEEGPNDVLMMRETLTRRLKRISNQIQNSNSSKENWPEPDLIILDGGKPQLNAGKKVLNELNLNIPIAALAKREEELFSLARNDKFISARLPRTSGGFYLLQRIRDEAHRFTISYHRLLRDKRMTKSLLEEIPGVGPITRKKLLRTFGSVRGIREATLEEIEKVAGTRKKAEIISAFLLK